MEELLIILKAQPVLVIILAVIAGLIIFAIVKKLVKILAVLCLVLCVYMGYLVYKGKLDVSVKKGFFSSSKKVAELGPGDFFGEMALLDKSPRSATVECAEDSQVFVLLSDQFNEASSGNPEFVSHMKSLAAARKFEQKQQE